jgi:Ca-activated chloride channel family protein
MTIRPSASAPLVLVATVMLAALPLRAQQRPGGQGFSFSSAVDLVTVTATVTDRNGRFVPGLRAEDFIVTENGEPQAVSQFEAERVPVSLGLVLDSSGSMAGDKMASAHAAVGRFVDDLLDADDEVFLYRFDSEPELVQDWTSDRRLLVRRLANIRAEGGTAMYDAMADAVPLAAQGARAKKAIVLISDGHDTDSVASLGDVRALIRESELLVYAIGIEGSGATVPSRPSLPIPGFPEIRLPWPGRAPASRRPAARGADGSVNAAALRQITDDSGGRTEIIGSARDLDRATAGIADELSQQYFLGYVSSLPKDGRWHTIDVRLKRGPHTVRARKGYVAD